MGATSSAAPRAARPLRSRLENDILRAVSRGEEALAQQLGGELFQLWASADAEVWLEVRALNALLNKTLADGDFSSGPLDRIYHQYGQKLNGGLISSQENCRRLFQQMLAAYCGFVRSAAQAHRSVPVQLVLDHIDHNLSSPLTLTQLAKLVRLNPCYLSTLFKSETGMTITAYIRQQRLHRACYLLQNTDNSITQIAVQTGMTDASYFTRLFRRDLGLTPSQYRTQYRVQQG